MGCESNRCCASLSIGLRKQLCTGCRCRFLARGSLENFEETRQRPLIIIDGLMAGTGYGDAGHIDWPDMHLSRAIVVAPGCLVNFRRTLFFGEDVMFASSFVSCETDCCIALFDQEFLESLYRKSSEFQQAVAKSAFDLVQSMSEFLSIALTPSMGAKIEQLLGFLTQFGIYLPEKSIA